MDVEQSWPPKQGKVTYRVTIRDIKSNANIGVLRNLEEPRCVLPGEWLQHPESTAMRVEAQVSGEDEWTTWIPFFILGMPENPVHVIKPPINAGGFPLRLIIYPSSSDAILLDETRMGDFPLLESLAPAGSRLRCRFMRYDHEMKKWLDLGGYMDLVFRGRELAIRVDTGTQPSRLQDAVPRPYLFTVDVEVNMRYQRLPDPATVVDEHVFGITSGCGSTGYGINYIMDALDARGMKGTFFVDVLMEYMVGERDTRRVIDTILSRGHDAQLHLHPNPNLYFADKPSLQQIGLTYARARDVGSFRAAMELATESYFRFTGKQPLAFRNGSYIFRDEYFSVLKEFGIKLDSSIFAFKNFHAPLWMRTKTTPFIHSTGILEIPITWMSVESPGENRVLQHTLKLGYQAIQVLHAMLEFWRRYTLPQVTLIHSYTLLNEHKDITGGATREWNNKLLNIVDGDMYKILHLADLAVKTTMDGLHLKREHILNGLLDTLAYEAGVRAYTFSELCEIKPESLVPDFTMEPVIVYDASEKTTREIGLQRYSSGYLQYLDDIGGKA